MQIPHVDSRNQAKEKSVLAEDRPRVIIKFRDKWINAASTNVAALQDSPLFKYAYSLYLNKKEETTFSSEFPTLKIERLFSRVNPTDVVSLIDQIEARKGDTKGVLNLLTYFTILCSTEDQAIAVAQMARQFSSVESATIDGKLTTAAQIDPSVNGAWVKTETAFLRKAPGGIDAQYAWSIEQSHGIKGGDGGGNQAALRFVDIEHGWYTHGDFAHPIGIDGDNRAPLGHGTACLGIVAASGQEAHSSSDRPSSLGITPNVNSVFCVSTYRNMGDTAPSLQDALFYAITYALDRGDVLLIEVYYASFEGFHNVPVEINPVILELIQIGTAKGITIIEPAGNTAQDTDLDTLGVPQLRRGSGTDSGAILVSAASSSVPHTPLRFDGTTIRRHAFGSRVDCYAWGENIYTTWHNPGDPPYCYFADTSGAAAIIAGAALSVQGLAKLNHGSPFDPKELRDILRNDNPNTGGGTRSHDPSNDRIGVMPDLRNIIQKKLRLIPTASSAPATPGNLRIT